MNSTWRKLLIATLFAIAMAYLESSVVVYLRKLYYPEGFSFPLKLMPAKIYLIEIGRELATLVMLVTVAWLVERHFLRWFMMMLFVWGVWDIFYYVWLKIFLGWPGDLMTADLLFLIPVPWVGPVLAPIIVSLLFIISAVVWLSCDKCSSFKPGLIESAFGIVGFVLIFVSFIYDFFVTDLTRTNDPQFVWSIFTAGIILLLSAGMYMYRKIRSMD